jgi:hypothetical protein
MTAKAMRHRVARSARAWPVAERRARARSRDARRDPRLFGRRDPAPAPVAQPAQCSGLADDLRLFGATFAAGFLFVAILIA